MAKKKPPATFEIVFRGANVAPEDVPLWIVAEAVTAIQSLSSGSTIADEDDSKNPITLLGVMRGSAIYQCIATDPGLAIQKLTVVGKLLLEGEGTLDTQAAFALRPLSKLSQVAKSLNCVIEIRQPIARKAPLAIVEAGSFAAVSKRLLIRGGTSLTGEVVRVGGATGLRCVLKIPGRSSLLYCDVAGQELSRALGRCLYQHVVIEGEAQWVYGSYDIFQFEITRVRELKTAKLTEHFDALYESGGHGWDAISDVAAYLDGNSK